MKIIFVVAGIIEYNGKILCMQRGEDKCEFVANKWEFPGGKIEPGETNEEALKREILEELNLKIDVIEHFVDVSHCYPSFKLNMYCYKCNATSNILKLNVHKNFKWLNKNQLTSLDWAPADIPVVENLIKI